MVEALVMDHNLSLLALEPATKAPLAVMLNGAFHRDEIDMPRQKVAEMQYYLIKINYLTIC